MKTPQQPPNTNPSPLTAIGKIRARIPAALALAATFALTQLANAQATYTWNATSGNWSTPANWTLNTIGPGPLAADSAIFGNTDTSASSTTVNNTVDSGFGGTIANLTYNSTSSTGFNVTQIPSGETLNVTGTLTVGEMTGNSDVTSAILTGGGTLSMTGPLLDVENFATSAGGQPAEAFLNLSALSNFVYNNSTGTVSVAGSLTGTRCYATFLLAGGSNNITAGTLNIGTCTGAQAGTNLFSLGSGTNVLNVANLNFIDQKNTGFLNFQSTTGGLRLRGVSGADTDRANITVANHNVAGGSVSDAGTWLMNGSPVDIKAGTLVIAETTGGSGTGTSTGNVQFDTGTLDATTIQMAYCSAGSVGSTATLSVGANGTLIVGSGGLSLANQTLNTSGNGPASGTLNISNGTVVCNGSITTTNFGTSTINFLTGGHLTLGLGDLVGSPAFPISSLTLSTNTILEFTIPSISQTNIVVNTLNWPASDSALTISVDGLIGVSVGSTIPLIQFATLTGTFTAPVLNLPSGVTGSLSMTGNTLWLTVTGGIRAGIGGLNQLLNPGFEQGTADWTTVDAPTFDNTPVITTSPTTFYDNSPSGACGADPTPELVLTHNGTNVANMYGQFTGSANTSSFSQSVATVAGSVFTAGAYTYVSHEDLMSGKNSFFYEVDFLDDGGNLLASYESTIVSNLTCTETAPFAVDTWNFLAVTNVMQVTAGVNSGAVIGSIATGDLTAPPSTAKVRFSAKFLQQGAPDQYDGGSIYFDDVNLGFLSGPTPPILSAVTPNLITLCTNTVLSCSATSTVSTISSFQLVVTSSTLGGTPTTVTNTIGSPAVTVTGLGTSSAILNYALKTNTVYQSVLVRVTDGNNVTVSAAPVTFDTLVPSLVIEASDFNFSSGQFIDTPPNGGLALYAGKVGTPATDENKAARTGATQGYYRPGDAVIIQGAAPGAGSPPSSTEQKFVTSLANGDTNDVEVEVGYNSVGDWLNYSRTYGSSGTVSAPSGTYNVWCYLATDGTGVQAELSLLTSDPTTGNQTTNFLGFFGNSTFTDASYNTFVYVPLVDQFGNRVSITLSNGVQTLKSTVLGNPNLGFYMLTPVTPVVTPVLQNVSPSGTVPFQASNKFTFTVGPANGSDISTNGIGLTLNGSPVTGGLTFTEAGGSITGNFTLQSNAVYNAVITVTNADGLSSSYTVSFDTFNINDYQWEAVDYDFSTNNGTTWIGGQFIDNPVPSGETTCTQSPPSGQFGVVETNSYFGYPTDFTPFNDPNASGAVAQQGIDCFTNAQTGVQTFYRVDDVGSQQATDYVRPKFLFAQTNTPPSDGGTICPFNLGYFNAGNWVNYTRTWPTNSYNVWGRLAGGNGAFSGTTLSTVTSGVGTSNQTTSVLGSFADPNAAGWQVYHWVELLDTNGNPAVVHLGGVSTLRVTSGNNLNAEFFMLTPAVAPASAFKISASVSGGNIDISIPTLNGQNYTVWYAGSLSSASWTQVGGSITGDGTVHVFSQPSTTGQGYYKVKATAQ